MTNTLNILRRLNSFDCHKVVLATLKTVAVIFSITQQYNLHAYIEIVMRSVVGNFWKVT